MLTIHEKAGLSRRELLRIGGLALGGWSLAPLTTLGALPRTITGKSVIFLFQQGGPPQFETFDPKPDAPDGIRTVTGVTRTSLPGVLFGDTMQQIARIAHKLNIVRSYQTGNAAHNIIPIVSPDSLNANIGCLVSRVCRRHASNDRHADQRRAVAAIGLLRRDARRRAWRSFRDRRCRRELCPFIPGGNGQLLRNLRLNLPPERFADRRELNAQLDRLNRHFDDQGFDRTQQQAAEVLLSGHVANALDLSREDPRIVAQYDTSRYVPAHEWRSAQRGMRGYYTGAAKSIGKLLLMARRLCEAGCGFVTIHADYEGVWDFHADGNNLNVLDGMAAVGRSFDHAVAAFVADTEARGLDDNIMLIATGEMGRTPRLNRNGGRDHWARLAPLMIYGGGTRGGCVIGQSTCDGGEPAVDVQTNRNLISTILHTCFDIGQLRLQPALTAISRLAEAPPIRGLF